ncbi:MAG: peptidase M6 [Streptosporangiales bacterium]|nr:peptidase M6 [Streptosporangiales bacterium]
MSEGSAFRGLRRAGAAALAGALALAVTAIGVPSVAAAPRATKQVPSDTRSVDERIQKQQSVDLSKSQRERFTDQAEKVSKANRTAKSAAADDGTGTPIGGEKNWLGLDDTQGYFAAPYVLRGVGDNIEVWVQKDLNYPADDCRNDGIRNVITDEQVDSLVGEFDGNILPKESKEFSVAPARDGTQQTDVGFGAPLWEILGNGDPDYFKGDGNKTVVLVSNVRDANFYDPTSPDGATYIAGFFTSLFNEGFDRNVMTIDSYDWKHRTGANPPDEGDGGLCSPNQVARPHLYEGTFAHEYQHLLEYYTDPGETTWLNEGLSDYAQTIVGYADTTLRWPAKGADSHVACFEGWYGTTAFPYCGAENSLTRWEDQGSPSTLSDYGAAYSFLTYVQNQFGDKAITYLHRNAANGLASLQGYLDDNAPGLTAMDVVHDWQAATTLDGFLDDGAKGLTKDQKNRFSADQLHSGIDWAWTGSYDSPGAPTNGSDYVLARDGRPLNGNTVGKLWFSGVKNYASDPLEWTVDSAESALWGGEGDNVDRAAVYEVAVPEDSPTLTFSTKYDIEQAWDFGAVQVSTDGGKTYTSLANDNTTSEHDPAAASNIVEQLPGFTGTRAEYATETFDLADYAGQTIHLSFRYMTDAATNGNGGTGPTGWWVKDVKVGDTVVTDGSTLDGAQSATQVYPPPVEAWKLQLVGWSLDGKKVAYRDVRVGPGFTASLSQKEMRKTFKGADRIGAIVSVDDSSESVTKYANYRLFLNGELQPGGAGDTSGGKLPASKQLNLR